MHNKEKKETGDSYVGFGASGVGFGAADVGFGGQFSKKWGSEVRNVGLALPPSLDWRSRSCATCSDKKHLQYG